VRLWDAVTGGVRGSYRAYDAVDEVVAATSVAFSACGSRLLAGFNKCLRVWDVARPGRECREVVTHRRRQDGLPGARAGRPRAPAGRKAAAPPYPALQRAPRRARHRVVPGAQPGPQRPAGGGVLLGRGRAVRRGRRRAAVCAGGPRRRRHPGARKGPWSDSGSSVLPLAAVAARASCRPPQGEAPERRAGCALHPCPAGERQRPAGRCDARARHGTGRVLSRRQLPVHGRAARP